MKNTGWAFGVAAVLACMVLICGCAGSGAGKPKELEQVTVKLKWLHQAQFAGNYIASEKGFYEEEGLNVSLVPPSFEEPTIDAVASGKAQIGITGAEELILARAKGLPLKAFAVIYKITPLCAYSLKSSGITKPQEFVGKTVGLEGGASSNWLYSAMMAKLGINRSRINEISIGYDATELLNGTTDVSTGYIINEPQQVMEAGYAVNTILIADYGVNMYADVLFAREDTLTNNPGMIESFLRATLNGWSYAIENEEEAVNATMKYATGSRSHQANMLRSSIPLVDTGETPIGWMEKSKWERAHEMLLEQKILDRPINIEDVYTMEFVSKVYGP